MLDMTDYSLISADSHVIEPPDLFTTRLPTKLRDRAPRLDTASGACRWSVEGESAPLPDSVVNGSGWHRPLHGPRSFEDVLPALYDPAQRLLAQDADGVAAEVLYPFPGLWDAIRSTADHELILGCVRAYNDWIAEFSAHSPDRLVGLGRIPMTGLDDPPATNWCAASRISAYGGSFSTHGPALAPCQAAATTASGRS